MLKVNSAIPKSIKQYCLKNTASTRYERAMDLASFSSLGLGVQAFRSSCGFPDFILSAVFFTGFVKGLKDAVKAKIDLVAIQKRAKDIKKASKH